MQLFFFVNKPLANLEICCYSVNEHFVTRSTSASKLCKIGRIHAVGQISTDAQVQLNFINFTLKLSILRYRHNKLRHIPVPRFTKFVRRILLFVNSVKDRSLCILMASLE